MRFEKYCTEIEEMTKDREPPGKLLEQFLTLWDKEPIITDDENLLYAGELWLSLKDYEKKISEELKGHDIILNKEREKLEKRV